LLVIEVVHKAAIDGDAPLSFARGRMGQLPQFVCDNIPGIKLVDAGAIGTDQASLRLGGSSLCPQDSLCPEALLPQCGAAQVRRVHGEAIEGCSKCILLKVM
jgi:hypothetical protein